MMARDGRRAVISSVRDQLYRLSLGPSYPKDGDFLTVCMKYMAFAFLLDRTWASGFMETIPCVRNTTQLPPFLKSIDGKNVLADLVTFFIGVTVDSVHKGIQFLRWVVRSVLVMIM